LYLLALFKCGQNFLIEIAFLQTSKAATLFAHEENKPFHFMHCWHKLKGSRNGRASVKEIHSED
jgi:hypothetical protein